MRFSGFWSRVRLGALVLFVAPVLAACWGGGFTDTGATVKRAAFTSSEYGVAVSPRVTNNPNPPRGGGRYQIGNPYTVRGVRYVPAHQPDYRAQGTASWYGSDFHGRRTANGEIFSANAITGAHPTLPLPSYVRVTNRDNGRSLVVRINDRGPYVAGRIIDLSHRAADLLGYVNRGMANVEVEYVGQAPLEGDDTRMLMASLTGAPAGTGGNVRTASNNTLAGMAGNFISGIFSYAEADPGQGEAAINSAHDAAMAMAGTVPDLASWSAALDEDKRDVDLALGIFADLGNAQRVVESFALLGAVDERTVTVNDRPATALRLTWLRPGVGADDVNEMARSLGLRDVTLY